MYCLFLDIAFGEGVFALFSDGISLEQQKCSLVDSRQPTHIFHALLEKRGLTLDDVTFIACGVGPGSYTGLRSAHTIARGISFCTHKKIVAIPSLLLFAPSEKGSYCIVANAGVGGVYSQKVTVNDGECFFEDPALVSMEAVRQFPEKKVAATAQWLEGEGILPIVVPSHVDRIASLAYTLYHQGVLYDAFTLPIFYLRKTQAELNIVG